MRALDLSAFVVASLSIGSIGLLAAGGTGCGSSSSDVGTTDAGQVFILSVRPSTATKNVGETVTFEAVITPTPAAGGPAVTWESSNPSVATVDANTGVATAIAVGTATITAHRADASANAQLTVISPSDAAPPDGGDAGGGKRVVYVSSLGGESPSSIRVFALDAKDDAAPLRSIVGANTKLESPSQMAVSGNELFVADGSKRVLVFDLGANGDVAPKRTIEGSSTGFTNFSPTGIAAIGSELFVSDQQEGIRIFPLNGMGNLTPTRTIDIGATKHISTSGIANELLVNTGVQVDGYLNSVSGSSPSVLRTLDPGKTGARGVYANATGVWIATTGGTTGGGPNDAIVSFAANAQTGAAPLHTIVGTNTGLDDPHGLGVEGTELFVANQGDSSVRVWEATAEGDVAPKRVIKGAQTGMSFPAGLLIVKEP